MFLAKPKNIEKHRGAVDGGAKPPAILTATHQHSLRGIYFMSTGNPDRARRPRPLVGAAPLADTDLAETAVFQPGVEAQRFYQLYGVGCSSNLD